MAKAHTMRPETAVLTAGYDPRLSVGSVRPAVFRSSTYVFSTPESAARAFDIALGRSKAGRGESVDLIYARLSHPNAEILEAQAVPLETDSTAAACGIAMHSILWANSAADRPSPSRPSSHSAGARRSAR